MWFINELGEKEFKGKKNDFYNANNEALKCSVFTCDVEEEMVSDEIISCYNCRFRRWTSDSFICCKILD